MVEVLSYERLLTILNKLDIEEKSYVLKFLLCNEQKCKKKSRKLQEEIDECEQERQKLRKARKQLTQMPKTLKSIRSNLARLLECLSTRSEDHFKRKVMELVDTLQGIAA